MQRGLETDLSQPSHCGVLAGDPVSLAAVRSPLPFQIQLLPVVGRSIQAVDEAKNNPEGKTAHSWLSCVVVSQQTRTKKKASHKKKGGRILRLVIGFHHKN